MFSRTPSNVIILNVVNSEKILGDNLGKKFNSKIEINQEKKYRI
jgi:hypothetical protein